MANSKVLDRKEILFIKDELRNESYNPGEYPQLQIAESTTASLPTWFSIQLDLLQKNRPKINEFDLIFSVIYAIALECGFYFEPSDTPASYRITQNWNFSFNYDLIYDHLAIPDDYIEMNGNVYKLNLNLVNSMAAADDENTDEDGAVAQYKFDFNLFCLKNGHSFLVTLVSNRNIKNSFSVYVPISKYLPFQLIDSQTDYKIFYRNLAELSTKLKDQLYCPARNFYFDDYNFVPHPSLFGIPYELLAKILTYLDRNAIIKLKLTCSRLNQLIPNQKPVK